MDCIYCVWMTYKTISSLEVLVDKADNVKESMKRENMHIRMNGEWLFK